MDKKPLIKERVTQQLRDQIRKLQQDDFVKIAPERELAENLNVSRISLRSAIKALVSEGLLLQKQGVGTYICPKLPIRALYILCPPDRKSNDPYYNQFLLEITNTSAQLAIRLTMVDSEQQSGDPDGVLVVMGLVAPSILERVSHQFGHVLLLQSGDSPQATVRIAYDDERIGRQAAEILLREPRRRIIHLAGPDKYPSAFRRRLGFTRRLAESGVECDIVVEKMNWPGGYLAGDRIIELLGGSGGSGENGGPAGIFAANDWMAVGLIQKLKEQGFRIPEDVAVIGCDDIPLAGEFTPALSTFRLDMKELVTRLLSQVSLIQAGGQSEGEILLPAPFVNRETTGS